VPSRSDRCLAAGAPRGCASLRPAHAGRERWCDRAGHARARSGRRRGASGSEGGGTRKRSRARSSAGARWRSCHPSRRCGRPAAARQPAPTSRWGQRAPRASRPPRHDLLPPGSHAHGRKARASRAMGWSLQVGRRSARRWPVPRGRQGQDRLIATTREVLWAGPVAGRRSLRLQTRRAAMRGSIGEAEAVIVPPRAPSATY
jgi:hypothetical protein